MFDFWRFYNGLFKRSDYFDNYWDQFAEGQFMFKEQTLPLLKESAKEKNPEKLEATISVISRDGADEDCTDILLQLLDEHWHISEEDIVSVLEIIKDPRSVERLYTVAINVPDYDEMRALAKKCMWALSAINTPEAIAKLKLLQNSDDMIIKENATFQLEHVVKRH